MFKLKRSSKKLAWIPDLVTWARPFFGIPIILLCVLVYWYGILNWRGYFNMRIVLYLFVIGLITDALDGFLAFILNTRSLAGKKKDQIADALYITPICLAILLLGKAPEHMLWSLFALLLWLPRMFLPGSHPLHKISIGLLFAYYIYVVSSMTYFFVGEAYGSEGTDFLIESWFLLPIILFKQHRIKDFLENFRDLVPKRFLSKKALTGPLPKKQVA